MNRDNTLLLIILAGTALALYASGAGASFDLTAGGAVDPETGLPVAPDDPNAVDTSETADATGDDPGAAAGDSGVNALPAPDPGINFGILSDLGAMVSGWQTGDYPKYASAITSAETSNGIPAGGLGRLLYQESRFRPDVIAGYKRSPVGAIGIAQFMPLTAADMGLSLVPYTYNGQSNNPDGSPIMTYDPFASIAAAGRYLRQLYGMFNDWKMALMAYNWGPGNVQAWNRNPNSMAVPAETQKYIAQIGADVPAMLA